MLTARLSRGQLLLALAAVLAVGGPGCLLTGCTATTGSTPARADAAAKGPAVSAPTVSSTVSSTVSPATLRKRSSPLALRLLTQAARAAAATAYQGEEMDTRPESGGGLLVSDSDIWHLGGGQTTMQAQSAASGAGALTCVSAASGGASPEGVLGVTAALVNLLENHYVVAYDGAASAVNRPVQVVAARRADGSLAALFYLDQATKLPLERRVFDTSANVIDSSLFINVQIGTTVSERQAQALCAKPQAEQEQADQAGGWTFPIPPAKLLVLGDSGWRVPPVLPGGLTLFTGAQTMQTGTSVGGAAQTAQTAQQAGQAGPVLDLGYSDGLYVISLFEQRGKLATKLAGWQKTTEGGRIVYASGSAQRSLAWSGNGMVYTLIADAPTPTVAAVVDALPYDKPPGFWKRMSRGLSRLASLVNPFH